MNAYPAKARSDLPSKARLDPGGRPVCAPGLQWDRLGLIASSLCAVHCLCLPWLLLAVPFLAGSLLADPGVERMFVLGSIFLAAACTIGGCRAHRQWWLTGLVTTGAVALIWVHVAAPPFCCARDLNWPHALVASFGGGLLALTHFFNLRLQRGLKPAASAACCRRATCSHRPL